ncbi:hypothetical protein BDQ12DRAFT_688432, partial [Crucibulum laeve]
MIYNGGSGDIKGSSGFHCTSVAELPLVFYLAVLYITSNYWLGFAIQALSV